MNVNLCVVSIAMKIETIVLYYLAKGKDVDCEEQGAENGTLGDTM